MVTTLNDQVGILLTIKSPINTKCPQTARDGKMSTISKANEKYITKIKNGWDEKILESQIGYRK